MIGGFLKPPGYELLQPTSPNYIINFQKHLFILSIQRIPLKISK